MSEVLRFTMTFHTPFLTATGAAAEGYDASIDLSRPLAPTAIKGLMRSAATDTLCLRTDLVERVFGSVKLPTAWRWSVEAPVTDVTPVDRHRVEIDDDTRTAVDNHLQYVRAGYVPSIDFTVERAGQVGREERVAVIASGRAIHAIGAQRRRGLGWVGVTGPELAEDDYAYLVGGMRS